MWKGKIIELFLVFTIMMWSSVNHKLRGRKVGIPPIQNDTVVLSVCEPFFNNISQWISSFFFLNFEFSKKLQVRSGRALL